MTEFDESIFAEFLTEANGFHHADWPGVAKWIDANVANDSVEQAWNSAARVWLKRLRADLGGNYSLRESGASFLLADFSEGLKEGLHRMVDQASEGIQSAFSDIAWSNGFGKRAVLIFEEHDDYFEYVSHFTADGVQISSAGMSIGGLFPHVVISPYAHHAPGRVIAHELSHDALSHLDLPAWLDEGIALTMEHHLSFGPDFPSFDEELAMRHFEFWSAEKIQYFWAGHGFYVPGEMSELCYNLAEVLFTLLLQDHPKEKVREFLLSARPEDAGQEAALRSFGLGLEKVVTIFLGPGEWEPDGGRIQEIWQQPFESASDQTAEENGLRENRDQ